MSTAAHTPGPWVTRPGDGCAEIYAGEPRDLVCTVEGGTQQSDMANATLIAAAPDLLAAMRALGDFIHQDEYPLPADLLEQCSAAIAKAEGRS